MKIRPSVAELAGFTPTQREAIEAMLKEVPFAEWPKMSARRWMKYRGIGTIAARKFVSKGWGVCWLEDTGEAALVANRVEAAEKVLEELKRELMRARQKFPQRWCP